MKKQQQPKPLDLHNRLACLYVYKTGSVQAQDRWGSYETYSYGNDVPIDPKATKKARLNIDTNGIDWVQTTSVYQEDGRRFTGTGNDSETYYYECTDIVSKDGTKYRFVLSHTMAELPDIIRSIDRVRNDPLLGD